MRTIDADELREEYDWCRQQGSESYWSDVIERLDNAPTLDAVPVVHAHWVDDGISFEKNGELLGHDWMCSACGHGSIVSEKAPRLNYCFDCGAKMDGGGENDKDDCRG